MLNNVSVEGYLTADPELRFTPSGAAVVNGTVAHTPRRFNKQTNEWEDGTTVFLRWSVWRDHAENIAESLQKGARVLVVGKLVQRNWEDNDGNKRSVLELSADAVTPCLHRATVKVNKTERSSGGGGFQGGGSGGGDQGGDPWSTGPSYDEPPF